MNRRPREKADHERVTADFLQHRTARTVAAGYTKPRWIEFCEAMLDRGYTVTLYEAKSTFSKYIYVRRATGAAYYKVRFSNHKPNKGKELEGDCHFFVGVTHTGVRTTAQAIYAVDQFFAKEAQS